MESEFTELGHFRLTPVQKSRGAKACEIKGVKAAAKIRELYVEWTEQTLSEHKILTGKK